MTTAAITILPSYTHDGILRPAHESAVETTCHCGGHTHGWAYQVKGVLCADCDHCGAQVRAAA